MGKGARQGRKASPQERDAVFKNGRRVAGNGQGLELSGLFEGCVAFTLEDGEERADKEAVFEGGFPGGAPFGGGEGGFGFIHPSIGGEGGGAHQGRHGFGVGDAAHIAGEAAEDGVDIALAQGFFEARAGLPAGGEVEGDEDHKARADKGFAPSDMKGGGGEGGGRDEEDDAYPLMMAGGSSGFVVGGEELHG